MNENTLKNEAESFKIFDNNLLGNEEILHSYPTFHSTLELESKISSHNTEIFLTPRQTLDKFLKEKFHGIGVPQFMQIYTQRHIGQAFCLPVVTPVVTCLFCDCDCPDFLSHVLTDYQAMLKPNALGCIFPNLHTDSTYKFTLIHANFSLTEGKNFSSGYYHKTENWLFFLKSSAQFDLTVGYKDL